MGIRDKAGQKVDPLGFIVASNQKDNGGPQPLQWANEKQQFGFEYPPHPLLLSGGFGSAKTYCLALKMIWLLDVYPGSRGLIARKVFRDLEQTTMETFFKILPENAYDKGRRVDQKGYLQLNNGSVLLWTHLDNPERVRLLRGVELNFCLFDQAEELEEAVFTTAMARLGRWDQAIVPKRIVDFYGGEENWRWKNPATGTLIPPSYMMLTCNPDTEEHWLYRRFHPESQEWYQRYRQRGYKMITMASHENRFLSRDNLEEMQSNDPTWVSRFVDGIWGNPTGKIHYIDKLSLISTDRTDKRGPYVDPKEFLAYIRNCCTLHRTLDHGDSQPTCVMWTAVDPEGNVFAFREYYQADLLVSQHRKHIADMSKDETYKSDLADPSIFYKVKQRFGKRWCIADEYKDKDHIRDSFPIHWRPGDNNERATRNKINEYLLVDPKRIHPITREMGSPRLFFILQSDKYLEGIDRIWRETNAQRREKIGEKNGRDIFSDTRNEKIVDHGYDCIRYHIASRPRLGKTKRKVELKLTYDDIPQLERNSRLMHRIPQSRVVHHRRQLF